MPALPDSSTRRPLLRPLREDKLDFERWAEHRRKASSLIRVTDSVPEPAVETGRSPADAMARLRQTAVERFDLELRDMRATMLAMASCCEQSLERLRDAKWVSFDAVSDLVRDLGAEAARERSRADRLSEELATARRELDEVRVERQKAIETARQAAAAEFKQELVAAREAAEAAKSAEAKIREELTAVRTRNQEIVDAQMLRLLEFKRELEVASAQAQRLRKKADPDETAPQAAPSSDPAPAANPLVRTDPASNDEPPEFAAIEAVLAGSPPVAAWPAPANS
jgi:DNA repair exonuclease SbcCD ATPase subunit